MKTPILKAWQWALVAAGVAFVGVGLNVTGETASPPVAAGISVAANSASPAVSTDAPVAGGTTTNELFRPSTNNVVPADLKVSPDLAEFIKLAQAGLGEDVMMAYITNFVRVFDLGSDEIIYLNDLGVPSSVITAMIQQDISPESAARKLAGNEPSPLPPGLALNSPASNVYPAQQTPAPQPEEAVVESAPQAPLAPTYAATDYAPQPASVSYFYNSLAPYGNWVQVSGYGLCWQPTVVCGNSDWRPYSDRGRWVYSDCGWYWLSDYSWGWAPFHYGRWMSHANYGWVWAPDSTWGSAWVSWRYSQNYCGWAPLPPEARFTAGIGFSFHHRAVGLNFEFGLGAHHYNFIPFDRFCDYSPARHRVSAVYVNNVYNQTKIINNIRVKGNNNTVINEGFDPAHVAAVTRSEVRKVAVRDALTPAGRRVKYDHLEREGNKLVVFRPQLPAPTPPRPAASGGRVGRENRDKAAVPTRIPATMLTTTGRPETPNVASSGSPRASRDNTTTIRPSSQPNIPPPTPPSETEQARVSVKRSSGGLAMRGEPRRAPIAPTAETTSGASRSEPNRLQNTKAPQRPTGAHNQPQAQPIVRQTPTSAPVQPAVRPVAEVARVERQQPHVFRPESRAPQAAPARPQFNPAPPALSQPHRVEPRNYSRPQLAQSESSARPAPPVYSPPPQSRAPAQGHSQSAPPQRGSSQPSSKNSDRGDRKK